jgi:hypothetical protein
LRIKIDFDELLSRDREPGPMGDDQKSDDPGDPIDHEQENVNEELKEFQKLRERLERGRQRLRDEIISRAGPLRESSMENANLCVDSIRNHSNPDVRRAALQILLGDEQTRAGRQELYQEIALDAQGMPPKVRPLALGALKECYRLSPDASVPKIHAEIPYDPQEDGSVKRRSYFCILDLLEVDWGERPDDRAFSFPEDMNPCSMWQVVIASRRRRKP